MSGLTVNNLPNEIIINILRRLDQKNLRNATLTCKLWGYLIESSCQWSLKVRCHHSQAGYDKHWNKFMRTTNRKFGTIQINEMQMIETSKLLELFQRHGVHVVKLYLMLCQIQSIPYFAELLKSMPNLRHVIIVATNTLVEVSVPLPQENLPELKKLKTLKIIHSDAAIVKYFQNAKLTTVRVRDIFSIDSSKNSGRPLEDFLNSQKMLTKLAFESASKRTTSMLLIRSMPFQLTKLSLYNIELGYFDERNLLQFLKVQAKSLKELALGQGFPSFAFEFVFANMTELNTLSVILAGMPQEREFYERLAPNRSITNLILLRCTGYSKDSLKLFQKLPNVHTVTTSRCCNKEILLTMAQSLCKLESLATHTMKEKNFGGVKFPALKILNIRRLGDKIDWNEFTKTNQQLTELVIRTIVDNNESLLDSDDIDQIANNTRLQKLRLGHRFVADKRFFDVVRNKCPDLKVLDLHRSSISDDLNMNIDCRVLQLYDEFEQDNFNNFFT